ncbi:unnamed protein product [Aureobasidium pullulans]|nr:unnamed protein product [Aureobasidium pullulans]
MNLLQYLIAPHEQQQETEQDQLPQHQDLTQNAHYSQAPASMPIHQRRTPHPALIRLYLSSLILSLEANPDVLASLIRTGGIAGLTTNLQCANQTGSVTQHSSHGYSTGSPNRAVRSQAPQISSHAATVENRQICFWWYHTGNCNRHPQSSNFNGTRDHCSYLHELTNEDDTLQFFPTLWHHGKGDCGLDRCRFSSTYRHLSRPFPKPKKNKKLKKSLQQSRQQPQIGDQKMLQQQSHQQSPQLHRSSTPASTQQYRSPPSAQQYRSPSSVHSTGSGNGQSGSFKAINAPFIPPPRMSNIPTAIPTGIVTLNKIPQTQSFRHVFPINPTILEIPSGPAASRSRLTKSERVKARRTAVSRKPLETIPYTTYPLEHRVPTHHSKRPKLAFTEEEGRIPREEKARMKAKMKMELKMEKKERKRQRKMQEQKVEDDEDKQHEDGDKYERVHGPQQQEDGGDEQDEHGEYGSDDVVMGDCDSDLDLGHEEGEINEVDGEWYMEGAADA